MTDERDGQSTDQPVTDERDDQPLIDERDDPSTDQPVTVVIRRRVRPGHDRDMADWVKGVTAVAARYPGNLGVDVVPPGTGSRQWTIVFRFDRLSHLRRWETSEDRAEWIAKAERFLEGEARLQVLTGLEYWFEPGGTVVAAPSRPRQALVTWLAIFPLATAASFLLNPLTTDLPIPVGTFLLSTILVVLMTWVVMPVMSRLFRRWLYPPDPG